MDFQKDIELNEVQINEAVKRQASLFAYYAEQALNEERVLKKLQLSNKVFVSALERQFRDQAHAKNQKLTERQLDAMLYGNDAYVRQISDIIECQTRVDQLYIMVDAFKQKKDMIVTLATNVRKEMENGLRFNKPATESDSPPQGDPQKIVPMG